MAKKRYSKAYVEITNVCNRSCSFCPGTKRAPKSLSVEEFSTIIKQLSPLTDYVYLHVMGEPLTHPNLCDFLRLATAAGLKCAITTNGTLLPRFGEPIAMAGVYKVNVSVHSFEGGEEEKYEKYLHGCLDFADFASRRGVLVVLRLWNRGHDGGLNDRTLHIIKERFQSGEWVFGARGARIRDKLHLEYGDRFDWPDMSAEDGGERVFCYGLRDQFGILSDGTVIPCCLDHEGDIALGNVFDTPLAEILEGERAAKIRSGFDKRCATEELCRRCGYARRFG